MVKLGEGKIVNHDTGEQSKFSLTIRKRNEQVHLDIEDDIADTKDGLFTIVLRVNAGNVVDYNRLEQVSASKYTGLEQIIIEELLQQ